MPHFTRIDRPLSKRLIIHPYCISSAISIDSHCYRQLTTSALSNQAKDYAPISFYQLCHLSLYGTYAPARAFHSSLTGAAEPYQTFYYSVTSLLRATSSRRTSNYSSEQVHRVGNSLTRPNHRRVLINLLNHVNRQLVSTLVG